MNHRNLMPAARVAARRKQRAVRRWVVLDTGCLLVLTAIGAGYFCCSVATAPAVAVAPAAIDISKLNASFASLRAESARVTADLQAVQNITAGPDWSVLLSGLARSLGDDVVLNAVECNAAATSGGDAAGDAGRRQVRLGGLARSQAAVTQFVLRVEAFRFFGRVQLVQTAPQALRGSECVGFRLVCTLPDGAGGK